MRLLAVVGGTLVFHYCCHTSSCLTFFLEDPSGYKLKGNEDRPLLLKGGRVGGHRAWSNASDVSMMPPAGYKEHRPADSFSEHLKGQMCKESR